MLGKENKDWVVNNFRMQQFSYMARLIESLTYNIFILMR